MLERQTILAWLRETDAARLEQLYAEADAVRRRRVGEAVHLRGLVEFSNACDRHCTYCGMRAGNRKLQRYRMSADEILACAREAVAFGYGTVVLQSGESLDCQAAWVAAIVSRIKSETPLAVTLSLGERPLADLALWRAAGADRYLLRFETSNAALFARIHPPRPGAASATRMELLGHLRALGYAVGSGVLIGIPGQTFGDLADDLDWFRRLDLDMIGVGPYIAHPDTPLGQEAATGRRDCPDQVPADERTTYVTMALARLLCTDANIPSTTALATLNRSEGRELGLRRGANVLMPNLTPLRYRALYEIYPAKVCIAETAEACRGCMLNRIRSIGRQPGSGRGDAPRRRGEETVTVNQETAIHG